MVDLRTFSATRPAGGCSSSCGIPQSAARETTTSGSGKTCVTTLEPLRSCVPCSVVCGPVRLHACNGRFVARAPTSSVVAYNHGSVSFAAENTSLMQELASHGYTVVAIQHAEQLAEFKALGRADSPEKKKADAELAQRLKEAPSAERPTLAVEYFQASTNTNRVVVERAADTSFVLSHIANVVAKIPSLRTNAIDTSSAHLVGFSLGGAVATETAKRDARALSVVNLDGGMYGTLDTKAPSQPYSDAVQQRERRHERQAAAPTRTARGAARHYPSQLPRHCGARAAAAARPHDGANESAVVSGGAKPARAGVLLSGGSASGAASRGRRQRNLDQTGRVRSA